MNDCAPRNENPDLLLGDLAQMPEQRFTDSELSKCLLYIEVLELYTWSDRTCSGIPWEDTDINSWLARPRREVEEVEGEPDWLI